MKTCIPLTPTLSDRPHLEYQGHTQTCTYWFFDPLSRSITFSPPPHILIHKGGRLHSCSVSEDTMAFSPAMLYASGEVFVSMSEEPLLPKMRDSEKKMRIKKKDSREGEWGRYSREEVIATELTHIESNGSWGFWKISQHPHPPFSPSYDASIYSLQ